MDVMPVVEGALGVPCSQEAHLGPRKDTLEVDSLSGIVFREASAEALLFGEVVRVIDGGQIGDPFLGVFAALCVNNVNAESRRDGIEEVYQAIAMVLSESSCAAVRVKGSFDDEKAMGNLAERLEFAEKAGTIVRRVRENGIEFFGAPPFDREKIRRFRDGVVAGRQDLAACAGDPNESFECIGLRFVHIDQDMDRGHHDFGMTEPGDIQQGLRAAQFLAWARGRLRPSHRRRPWWRRGS